MAGQGWCLVPRQQAAAAAAAESSSLLTLTHGFMQHDSTGTGASAETAATSLPSTLNSELIKPFFPPSAALPLSSFSVRLSDSHVRMVNASSLSLALSLCFCFPLCSVSSLALFPVSVSLIISCECPSSNPPSVGLNQSFTSFYFFSSVNNKSVHRKMNLVYSYFCLF